LIGLLFAFSVFSLSLLVYLDLSGDRATALPSTLGDEVDDVAGGKKRRRESMLTLSGLLNFIDGLWSAHSGERIIVFTTNHLDKLDPALIRRGRMDKHIEMSYCRFEAFRTLAENYLGVDAHPLFDDIKELLQVVDMTPADVAEYMMVSKRGARDADACLGSLVHELTKKSEEQKKVEEHDATMTTDGSKEKLPSEIGKKHNAEEDAATEPNGEEIMANGVNNGDSSSRPNEDC
jgi:chaperone BCS1